MEADMLKDINAVTMVPVKDIRNTRRFYEEQLGFAPVREGPEYVVYSSGTSQINLYATEAGTSPATLIGWFVQDIERTVDELTASGVTFEQYDYPDFRTDAKGIATMGEDKAAWFRDPEGNILSLWQSPTMGG